MKVHRGRTPLFCPGQQTRVAIGPRQGRRLHPRIAGAAAAMDALAHLRVLRGAHVKEQALKHDGAI